MWAQCPDRSARVAGPPPARRRAGPQGAPASAVLALQRRAGNRAVATLARLALDEHPVQATKPPLTSITEFKGGNKGVVFCVENADKQRLVVKFQKEAASEAIVGTRVVQQAGGATPGLRPASKLDVAALRAGVAALGAETKEPTEPEKRKELEELKKLKVRFDTVSDDTAKWPIVLLMDYARGKTIKKEMEESPERLVEALRSRGFQESLGRILAADTFSGNPDRAMAIRQLGMPTGWYHEQNLVIDEPEKGTFKAVAIDNAFKPSLPSTAPLGVNAGGMQLAGTTAGSPQILADHAGLIFDRMIKQLRAVWVVKEGRPDDRASRIQELATQLEATRESFVAGVVAGGNAAMAGLLRRGQGWKQQFRTAGAGEQRFEALIDDHRVRKRFIRLLHGGVDPTTAHKVAKDPAQYHAFVLQKEKGMTEAQATDVVSSGRYKETLRA